MYMIKLMPLLESMSRQDFQLIANVIKSSDFLSDFDRSRLARKFAGALKSTNSMFDSEKFVAACGVKMAPGNEQDPHDYDDD